MERRQGIDRREVERGTKDRREDKLRMFAKLWGNGTKEQVIVIRMIRAGYKISLGWVKVKVARMRHFT